MKEIRWDPLKSQKLKDSRGVSFEEILRSRFITALNHPTRKNQKVLIFEHKNYIWVVPFVEKKNERFLKTLFPSRKYTQMWKKGEIK